MNKYWGLHLIPLGVDATKAHGKLLKYSNILNIVICVHIFE